MRSVIGTLGRITMVAVAAILIGGYLAPSVEARQRPEATAANEFIDFCFGSGGDPDVLTYPDGQVIVICSGLPGTGDYVCSFVGMTRDCWIRDAPTPGGNLPVLEPGDLSNFEPAPMSPSAAAAPADNQDDEQVIKAEPKKKQAKKAKKGKGNGKAKQRGKGRGGR